MLVEVFFAEVFFSGHAIALYWNFFLRKIDRTELLFAAALLLFLLYLLRLVAEA